MELIVQPTAFTCGQACPAPRQQIIIPRRARTRHKNKLQPQATPWGWPANIILSPALRTAHRP